MSERQKAKHNKNNEMYIQSASNANLLFVMVLRHYMTVVVLNICAMTSDLFMAQFRYGLCVSQYCIGVVLCARTLACLSISRKQRMKRKNPLKTDSAKETEMQT